MKLGQFWLAYVRGEPDKAKTASDRIFGEYFPLVFDPSEMNATRVIAVWRLYLKLENERRVQIGQSRRITRTVAEQEVESSWVVEGLYHFAYAVKKLADNANIDVFDFERVEPLVGEAAQRLTKFASERRGISYYRLFRTAATKQSLFESSLNDKQLKFDLGADPSKYSVKSFLIAVIASRADWVSRFSRR